MSSLISTRLPKETLKLLDEIAKELERSRTYLINKAIENYLAEYANYQIALDRLRNKDDEIISSGNLKKQLGL